MASKEFKQTYLIDFQSNVSGIIDGLKQVQAAMKSQASNVSIFDKSSTELVKLEQMVEQFNSKLQQGVKSKKDFDTLSGSIGKISTQIQSVTAELEQMAKSSNSKFQFKEIDDTTKQINKLKDAIKTLTGTEKDAKKNLETSLKGLNISEDQAKQISSQVKTQEQLQEALERELAKRREILEVAQKTYDEAKEKAVSERMGASRGGKVVYTHNLYSKRGKAYGETTQAKSATAADEIASNIIKQGIKESQSLETIQTNVLETLKAENFQLISEEQILNRIASIWKDIDGRSAKAATELNKATKNYNILGGTYNPNTSPHLSTGATAVVTDFGVSAEAIAELDNLRKKVSELETKLAELQKNKSLDSFIPTLEQARQLTDSWKRSTQQQIDQTQKLAQQNQDLNNAFDNFGNRLKYIFSFTNAYQQLNQVLRQTLSDVQSLDKAFGSIAMVTDMSIQDLWGSYSDYAEIAGRLGQSTQGAIEASSLFYQQGLNTAESLALTEDTMKLATLAGADFETATTQMTAALRGFHMEMDRGEHITDVYSELAANAAADVNQIAYAMSKTASIGA